MEEIYKWGNIVDHQKIFATNLFILDDFLPQVTTAEKYIVDGMKKYISDLWVGRKYDENWQTKSADLHKKKEFKYFAESVIVVSKKIINALDYSVEDIIITDMWANVLKDQEHHPMHTHSNNFLSGVFYLESDAETGIIFSDPRPAADVLVPRKKTKTNENSNLLSYISKQNRLIIFPSWLVHWVPINKSKRDRISISFNVQIKGQVGEHHEFQSAEY